MVEDDTVAVCDPTVTVDDATANITEMATVPVSADPTVAIQEEATQVIEECTQVVEKHPVSEMKNKKDSKKTVILAAETQELSESDGDDTDVESTQVVHGVDQVDATVLDPGLFNEPTQAFTDVIDR